MKIYFVINLNLIKSKPEFQQAKNIFTLQIKCIYQKLKKHTMVVVKVKKNKIRRIHKKIV